MNKIVFPLLLLISAYTSLAQNVFEIARYGTVTDMQVIYEKNPESINEQNNSGYDPLTLACYNSNVEVVKFLIDKVKNINGVSKFGTPLMAAVYKKNEEIIDILLMHNVDVNKTDSKGTTALHYATLFNDTAIAEKLINSGAKANLKDGSGKTAFDYASSYKNQKIITLIKNKQL